MNKLVIIFSILTIFFISFNPYKKNDLPVIHESSYNIPIIIKNYFSSTIMEWKRYDRKLKKEVYQTINEDYTENCFVLQFRTNKEPAYTYLIGILNPRDSITKGFYIRWKDVASFYKDVKEYSTLYTNVEEKYIRKFLPNHKGKIIKEKTVDTMTVDLKILERYLSKDLIQIVNKEHPPILDRKNGRSGSLKNAKKLNVFVFEYKTNKVSINYSNNNYIYFDKIWQEKIWAKEESRDDVIFLDLLKDHSTLYIQLKGNKKKISKELNDNLAIMDESKTFLDIWEFRDYFCLYKFDENSYFKDSIKFFVVTPDFKNMKPNQYKWNNLIVKDSFYLIRKNLVKKSNVKSLY